MQPILRARRDAVSPVVAEILIVAITVVVAAVLYLMVSGLLTGRTETKPVIALSSPIPYTGNNYNSTLLIAGASQSLYTFNYRFNLRVNTVWGNATDFAGNGAAANITVSGTAYRVVWVDVGGGGTLNQGDEIQITGRGVSLPAATSFEFLLVWSDGSALTTQAWTTP